MMKRKEQGAALVIGLLLLAVATIVGVAGLSSSNLQERISANQKQQTEAMMAAESGMAEFASWLAADTVGRWGDSSWKSSMPAALPDSDHPDSSFFWIEENNTAGDDVAWGFDCDGNPDSERVCILVHGHAIAGVTPLSNIELSFEIERVPVPLHPAFSFGIIANAAISISGNATITGNIHSNLSSGDGVTITGGGTEINGNVSAVNTVSVNGTVNGDTSPNSDPQDIPVITADYLNDREAEADFVDGYGGSTCDDLQLNGDLGGVVIFCNTDIVIYGDSNGEFSNVTIISRGNIRINGNMDLDANGDLSVGIIANGEIDFNGSRDSVAAFWSNGDYIQSGSASGNGSIVSGGSITQDGKFDFIQAPISVLPDLPPGAPVLEYAKWQEIRG